MCAFSARFAHEGNLFFQGQIPSSFFGSLKNERRAAPGASCIRMGRETRKDLKLSGFGPKTKILWLEQKTLLIGN